MILRTALGHSHSRYACPQPGGGTNPPRQCCKTTLAHAVARTGRTSYFDLEDPRSLTQLAAPMTALEGLQGLVVIDEVQRRPELFPVLRVLADRRPLPARFLILGSASPVLLRPEDGSNGSPLLQRF
jgi:uncharacterized protein